MSLADYGCPDIELLDGETVGRAIRGPTQRSRTSGRPEGSLLLTSRRLIHIAGSGHGAQVTMATIGDVDAVEITSISEGYSAFVWAGLSVVLAVVLYGSIDNALAKVIVPLLVLAMGGFLVVNRLFFTGGPAVVFRTGGSTITWRFETEEESLTVRDFIDELYRVKVDDGVRKFAPR